MCLHEKWGCLIKLRSQSIHKHLLDCNGWNCVSGILEYGRCRKMSCRVLKPIRLLLLQTPFVLLPNHIKYQKYFIKYMAFKMRINFFIYLNFCVISGLTLTATFSKMKKSINHVKERRYEIKKILFQRRSLFRW